MPNRILREGITTSEALAAVSVQAENLFYRLMVVADDYGSFDGRPVIIRSRCLPLRDTSVVEVEGLLRELSEQSLIEFYQAEGKTFLGIRKFDQRAQSKPKYPAPPWITVSHGEKRSMSYSEAESYSDSNAGSGAEPPAAQPPVVLLPLNDGSEYPVTGAQVREFTDLYRAVDVEAQLRAMRGWLLANPSNRKTRTGIMRFVNRWLGQEQNKAAKSSQTTAPAAHKTPAQALEPSETPLERQMGWLRQQRNVGAITDDQFLAEAKKAREKYANA